MESVRKRDGIGRDGLTLAVPRLMRKMMWALTALFAVGVGSVSMASTPRRQLALAATSVSVLDASTVTYYRSLVARAAAGETLHLEDFDRTFYPVAALEPSLDKSLTCPSFFSAGCEPDTYYSWGERPKTNTIGTTTSRAAWPAGLNRSTIYLNQSAIGSYCYGTDVVRFKFRSPPTIGGLNTGIRTYNEWTIGDSNSTSSANVESVSFGQPQHFDEIVTEIKLRLDANGPWNEAPLYVNSFEADSLKEKLLKGCVPERQAMTEATLVKNLLNFLDVIFKQSGWIHYNKCPECTPSTHFQTTWPTFFNPR